MTIMNNSLKPKNSGPNVLDSLENPAPGRGVITGCLQYYFQFNKKLHNDNSIMVFGKYSRLKKLTLFHPDSVSSFTFGTLSLSTFCRNGLGINSTSISSSLACILHKGTAVSLKTKLDATKVFIKIFDEAQQSQPVNPYRHTVASASLSKHTSSTATGFRQ